MATLREQIESLYIGYLNRAPDPAGLGFWLDAANSGLSLAAMRGCWPCCLGAELLVRQMPDKSWP